MIQKTVQGNMTMHLEEQHANYTRIVPSLLTPDRQITASLQRCPLEEPITNSEADNFLVIF